MKINKFSVLVVEDEMITRMDIGEILQGLGFDLIFLAEDYEEALEVFESNDIDLILADIKLKSGKSGIDLIKKIRSVNTAIPFIYITANTDERHKSAAFETEPSAIISKPFNENNLILAIELAMDKFIKFDLDKPKIGSNGHLFLKAGKRFEKVPTQEVLYIKAEGSYSRFVTTSEEYLQSGNLGYYSQRLSSDFLRVHKSFIVNYAQVSSVTSDKIQVGKKEIPIGRMYKEGIKKLNNK